MVVVMMKKVKTKNNGLLPNSLRIISSCLKTVSTNASTVASTVRSAGASVAASISSSSSEDHKDQVHISLIFFFCLNVRLTLRYASDCSICMFNSF